LPLTPCRDRAPKQRAEALDPAQLARELRKLRRKFAPFLRQLSPRPKPTRTVHALTHADWRLIAAHDPAALRKSRKWRRVSLPHYGPPIGPAHAVYRFRFRTPRPRSGETCAFLRFDAVDYHAEVFLNGRRLGAHEGFFAPFEFEVSDALRSVGWNTLIVHVRNDAISMGNRTWGQPLEGDKLYAATGLGWDEPGSGWHHCPPGMGIWQSVRFEWRSPLHLTDVWVRPLFAESKAEIRVELRHLGRQPADLALTATVRGRNYRFRAIQAHHPAPVSALHGVHHYRFEIALPGARTWTPDAPWLHDVEVELRDGQGRVMDAATTTFGLREFVIDEASDPRGELRLNGTPLRLRGANTMGFEAQRVMRGEPDGLRDDLLLARLAGMNFLRLTQHPVQPEVYSLCDALGLMVQTDLPLFARVRRTQFHEALKQAAELERLVRSHASVVIVSLINEPFPASWGDHSHRHLDREELARFLAAAALAVQQENPDRQVKPIDGDYDPPHEGLPDNHAYPGWYNGHGLDLGKLHKGHWVAVKPRWLYACGEFGSEGLDPEALMRRRYPRSWLPHDKNAEAVWTPSRIAQAQTGDLYPLWMDRQQTVAGWVAASQAHQAWITRLMTEAFRRDPRMVAFALHLFIDAWPAGWLKSIVDCERTPKPAFFAYRAALAPLLVSLRSDRLSGWAGEALPCEIWLCNDHAQEMRVQLEVTFESGNTVLGRAERIHTVPALSSQCIGVVHAPGPDLARRGLSHIRARARDAAGRLLSQSTHTFTVFPRPASGTTRPLRWLGDEQSELLDFLRTELGARPQVNGRPQPGELVITNDPSLAGYSDSDATNGCLVLDPAPGTHRIGPHTFHVEACGFQPRHFVSRATAHPLVAGFEPRDFCFWHDAQLDRPAPLLHRLFFAAGWRPILSTGQCDWGRPLRLAYAAAESPDGRVRVCSLDLAGRTRTNPVAYLFAQRLLQ
jgi:hypothetical protein